MMSRRGLLAMGSLLWLPACAGDAGSSGDFSEELVVTRVGGVDTPSRLDADGPFEFGQSRQAQVDTGQVSGCFSAVPPFVNRGDFFSLTTSDSFIPTSRCQAGEVYFFMVDNFVKGLGIPVARPLEAPPENCADLEVFFAIGRYGERGARPEVVARGSKRGQVVVSRNSLSCSIDTALRPADLDDMPDGQDYIFAVQALDDARTDDFSELVEVFQPPN